MKKLAILGSTGSIGRQALEVIADNPERWQVEVLSAHHNIDLLEQQITKFQPKLAIVADPVAGECLRRRYVGPTRIYCGEEAMAQLPAESESSMVLVAVMGAAGILPTWHAIAAAKDIALANKETLVAAGDLVMAAQAEKNIFFIPVDSEHSAIFQCLEGYATESVKEIVLTASGGPFRGKTAAELQDVSIADCLAHPTWSMGKKITVDSSTLFNKGLEVIEAHHLFGTPYERIKVVVHPQSIVHSMVVFRDGAYLAQLGMPSMKLPIQLAFSYPERIPLAEAAWDLSQPQQLTFEPPDWQTFPALQLAYEVGQKGGLLPAVMNAANEVAVAAFLDGRISYPGIFRVVEEMVQYADYGAASVIEDVLRVDAEVRRCTARYIEKRKRK